MLWIYWLLLILDLVWTHDPVFVSRDEAQQLLVRRRRANSFFEELKPGDMERECMEEHCNYEEAREIFENNELTDEFWAKYVDGDACVSSPCQDQGLCKDTVGGFYCICETGFMEPTCYPVSTGWCRKQDMDCHHFCEMEQGGVQCSCADGYFLSSDNRSCESTEPFKCGVIHNSLRTRLRTTFYDLNQTQDQDQTKTWINQTHLDPSLESDYGVNLGVESPDLEKIEAEMNSWFQLLNTNNCPPGDCPWQALLVNEDHRGFCGGTILSDVIILTAAHCMNQSRYMFVVLGELNTTVKHGNEAVHLVEKVLIHLHFRPETHHNDIALIKLKTPIRFNKYIIPACLPTKDFAEKVLMRQHGLVSGFGHLGESSRPSSLLQRLGVPYVDRVQCIEATEFRLSSRMFCAGYGMEARGTCVGDLGGPHVTRYRGTYFVTGITAWAEGCTTRGHFTAYTQVSKYLLWIREGIRVLQQQSPDQNQNQGQPKRKRSSRPCPQQVLGPDQDPLRTKRSQMRPRSFTVFYR